MSNYIYSTLTNSIKINEYAAVEGGTPRSVRSILIVGGSNVADKHFITPQGVVTEVSDEELEFLKRDKMFNRMVERGFIKHESKKSEVNKVAADMVGRDESAPLTPDDFTEDTKGAKPTKKGK